MFVLVVMMGSQYLVAQSIDEERMERDLEVAKNILATLMKNEMDSHIPGRGIEANYVEGYGVIFTIPRHYVYFHVPPPKIKAPRVIMETIDDKGTTLVIEKDEGNLERVRVQGDVERARRDLERAQRDLERAERDMERARREQDQDQEALKQAQDELNQAQKELKEAQKAQAEEMKKMKEEMVIAEQEMEKGMETWGEEMAVRNKGMEKAMITFLADYADLIGQLKPEDRIRIKQESPYENFVWTSLGGDEESEDDQPNGLSIEVSKKDITAYKSGKITLDEFKERVAVKKKEPEKRAADLEMFASIFKQYYSPKLSNTFFTDGTPSYEVLEGFGVIYNIKTYSSYVEGNLYYMPVLGEEKVNSEKRKEAIEELYPHFEQDIKDFIVDYGRTIRTLDDDDRLILRIKMTRCNECSIPKSIEVSTRMEVLRKFDQQKITRDKALEAIEVRKNFES